MQTKKLSRRSFLLGVGSAAGLSLLAACATPAAQQTAGGTDAEAAAAPAADKLIEIEYWHRSSGDTALLFETFAGEFSDQFADEIKVTSIFQGSIQELNQKVRAAAAGGGLPGALMADDYDVTQYTFSNILVDLTEYVAHPEYGRSQEQIDDILPNQFNRHKLDIYDGRMMALTQGFSGFATFWDLCGIAQIGMERPPHSWNDSPDSD